jgi:hypothetical protein
VKGISARVRAIWDKSVKDCAGVAGSEAGPGDEPVHPAAKEPDTRRRMTMQGNRDFMDDGLYAG